MARTRKDASSATLTTAQRPGSLVRSARDIRRKDKGLNGDLDMIIDELLEKYADHGTAQFTIPDVFEVPPISQHGNLKGIAAKFGGTDLLLEAVKRLQQLLYVA